MVIANTGRVPIELVSGQQWVEFTEDSHKYNLEKVEVVRKTDSPQQKHDAVPRPVLIHDSIEMNKVLRKHL